MLFMAYAPSHDRMLKQDLVPPSPVSRVTVVVCGWCPDDEDGSANPQNPSNMTRTASRGIACSGCPNHIVGVFIMDPYALDSIITIENDFESPFPPVLVPTLILTEQLPLCE